jgi:AcrR family transcriptional regulator
VASRRTRQNGSTEDRTKRQERAERILDAAAELTQRWGYNKTTIDDIAKQAGVAKGTIYLHWKTREELFQAMMVREDALLGEDIQQRMACDPEGMTMYGLMKHSILAISKRPLMKAVITRDTDLLGEWMRHEYNEESAAQRLERYNSFLNFLRDKGLIRTDLSILQANYILTMVTIGALMADPWLLEGYKVTDEEAAELVAETVQRVLEPRVPPTREAYQEISQSFSEYMDYEINAIKERHEKELQS